MRALLTIVSFLCLAMGASWAQADPAAGEAFFNGGGKCKNCHNTSDKKKVGPGLSQITQRAGEDWIKAFLNDTNGVWAADEGYTKTLKAAMNKTGKPKPAHKTRQLTETEINDLLDFLKTLQ